MIGADTGASGGLGQPIRRDAVRETWDEATGWMRDRLVDALEPVWDLVGRVVDAAIWVLERVAIVYPVIHERWETTADERVCPECGPLHGTTWPEGEGFSPPLHVNCRCRRAYAHTEWRTRDVDEWRLRWTTRTEWEWQVSGWR